ncbi:type I-E CRISPR-associated protein Cas6/Cse3/CasE [Brooklawnia propionicigenes]|uniref:Type I-E CRISPR-associated protein Cas6/Cse3/CasE n=1 Tax=Brooklawnia propionicigenes TaxID=3041175 RepID=A0AAN0MF18_9ACTN|nr:type I-E CRISPR-associated protein Cas6/Cse3/CasE [Brooklawnia sp. SH051]BEH01378.1 type I-E CRISPR-associated protein Cas6/Cse3/CasE [Brooklawnia sp. SH051]
MFLTRIEVDPMRRKARQLLADPQAMHACVMRACAADESASAEGRVLWRVDQDANRIMLYMVSPWSPHAEELQSQIGWSEGAAVQTADYEPFLKKLHPGQTYAFRLTANPTHVVTEENGAKRRFGHVTEAQQRQWLLDRCEANGFRIRTSDGRGDEPITELVTRDRTIKTFRRKGRPVTITVASFSGALEIMDADLLRSALTNGIGRAKAYGCGLLTLAR